MLSPVSLKSVHDYMLHGILFPTRHRRYLGIWVDDSPNQGKQNQSLQSDQIGQFFPVGLLLDAHDFLECWSSPKK
jgi:hypothetical protein